jgi:hypothetical protein
VRKVTEVYGTPVPERMGALRIAESGTPTLEWVLRDSNGLPVNLGDCPDLPIVLRIGEAMGAGVVTTVPMTVMDAATGLVAGEVDADNLGGPGIYTAEVAVMASDAVGETRISWSNRLFLTVDRSLFGTEGSRNTILGPPTIAEIRLHLRDSSPGEHRLIETVTFDDAEIAACIARPVMYFEEILPPLDTHFNTQSFPFRFHWLEGIKANLFWIAAEYYRKNHLRYQAAGVAADDLDKANDYEKKAAEIWASYKEFAHNMKIKINIEAAYGIQPSQYSYAGGYYFNGVGY